MFPFLSFLSLHIFTLFLHPFAQTYAKLFFDLVTPFVKDNKFNYFENWLLTARFNNSLMNPLPTEEIIKSFEKERMSAPFQPFKTFKPVAAEAKTSATSKASLKDKKKGKVGTPAAPAVVEEKPEEVELLTTSYMLSKTPEDAMLVHGTAVSEDEEFARVLIRYVFGCGIA